MRRMNRWKVRQGGCVMNAKVLAANHEWGPKTVLLQSSWGRKATISSVPGSDKALPVVSRPQLAAFGERSALLRRRLCDQAIGGNRRRRRAIVKDRQSIRGLAPNSVSEAAPLLRFLRGGPLDAHRERLVCSAPDNVTTSLFGCCLQVTPGGNRAAGQPVAACNRAHSKPLPGSHLRPGAMCSCPATYRTG